MISPQTLGKAAMTTLPLLGTALLFLGGSMPCRAAIWQTPLWALTATAEGEVGYDSNLFSRKGGDGDAYAMIAPTFMLQRLNSLTRLEVDISVQSFTFLDRTDLNSLNPSLGLRLRYPSDEELLTTQEIDVHASRRTEANSDVGSRLRRDDFDARWEGSFSPTGKIRVLARTEIRRTDYLTPGFNTNDATSAGLTAAYISNERLQLGAGYDFEYSHSQPDNPTRLPTNGRRHLFTFRGRGEFLPKVTGRFYLGTSYTDYRGGVTRTDWDLIAGASLVWQATARGQLTAKAGRLAYFSPDGSTSTRTGLGFEWTQQIIGGFSATLGVDIAQVLYLYSTRTRHDRLYGGRFQFRYALTDHFSASVGAGYTTQSSEELFGNYDRGTLFASLVSKF